MRPRDTCAVPSQQKDRKLEHSHMCPILPKVQMKKIMFYIKLFLNLIHEIGSLDLLEEIQG